MPKSTIGGVTDTNVDPDYTAPPGVAPADAIDQDLPDATTDVRPSEREAAEDKEDEPSPGKTSSPRSTKRKQSTSEQNGVAETRSSARNTSGPSTERRKGSSTASTEDMSSRPDADQG